MAAIEARYKAFQVTDEFFCCWDTLNDMPCEIGAAASYISLTGHYAFKTAHEKNGRPVLVTDWKDHSKADNLPMSKVITLVSYMCALHDYKLDMVPRLLDKVRDALQDYEADLEARRIVNEVYGGAVS